VTLVVPEAGPTLGDSASTTGALLSELRSVTASARAAGTCASPSCRAKGRRPEAPGGGVQMMVPRGPGEAGVENSAGAPKVQDISAKGVSRLLVQVVGLRVVLFPGTFWE